MSAPQPACRFLDAIVVLKSGQRQKRRELELLRTIARLNLHAGFERTAKASTRRL
jgi:hypothetical protein